VPGLGEVKGVHAPGAELGPVPWPPTDLPCCELSAVKLSALGRWTGRQSLRPPFNDQLRTGTDKGNPTV
jgi:hypothetical protein